MTSEDLGWAQGCLTPASLKSTHPVLQIEDFLEVPPEPTTSAWAVTRAPITRGNFQQQDGFVLRAAISESTIYFLYCNSTVNLSPPGPQVFPIVELSTRKALSSSQMQTGPNNLTRYFCSQQKARYSETQVYERALNGILKQGPTLAVQKGQSQVKDLLLTKSDTKIPAPQTWRSWRLYFILYQSSQTLPPERSGPP